MTISRTTVVPLFGLLAAIGCLAGCDEPLGFWPATAQGGVGGAPAATGGVSIGVGGGGAGGAASTGLLLDDFEDGNGLALVGNGWYSYNDRDNGGLSTINSLSGQNVMVGDGFESAHSLLATYTFDKGTLPWDPFVGFGLNLGNVSRPYDLSEYTSLSYVYQGGAHEVRVETTDVKDYDYHAYTLPASSTWRSVELPFGDFVQGGFGAAVALDLTHVAALSWHVRGTSGQSNMLMVDDVRVVSSVAPPSQPDLVVNLPAPPADATIASIAITNPLQAKAMRYLDRGYNITNWLESAKFAGFAPYDESYVAKLAQAGFNALRLPIDLDLYVDQRTVNGTEVSLVLSPDLFAVLDAFDLWTQRYGLSLTIDYHQYDKSFDIADAASVAETVELWSAVAEHFSSNPREDVFFELVNEPELFAAGTPPTAAQWAGLAEDMIAAIRVHDTLHTIIFGDVQWYGISALVQRAPLTDSNVVYAFHFYEPFVFTHQGASWAGMGTTHDIPYPYAAERWSEYSSDLGFTQVTDAWLWNSLRAYYQTGNKSALRNQIIQAKRWAVEHDVPVICNEFGAYDRSSQPADRVRYYTDLVDIFAELAIPWQHWFMLMDATTGAVNAEYTTAFRLVPAP
jgi:endoglucanase